MLEIGLGHVRTTEGLAASAIGLTESEKSETRAPAGQGGPGLLELNQLANLLLGQRLLSFLLNIPVNDFKSITCRITVKASDRITFLKVSQSLTTFSRSGSANFFYKGPDGTYLRLNVPQTISITYSVFFLTT